MGFPTQEGHGTKDGRTGDRLPYHDRMHYICMCEATSRVWPGPLGAFAYIFVENPRKSYKSLEKPRKSYENLENPNFF